MADQDDQAFFLSIFLMEAWDTLAIIEEGLGRSPEPARTMVGSLDPMVVVAHRLKGAAAIHGFSGVSEVAGVMELILERAPRALVQERERAVACLRDAVACLKSVLDGISASGQEDLEALAVLKAHYPAFFPAPSIAAAHPPPRPAEEPSVGIDGSGSQLVQELDRFFSENADILVYFGPEAAEHLEAMTHSLLALERLGPNEEELASLFRAVHTLKGAAHTVGCAPIGELAHQIEDLLMAVREHQVPFTPAVIEAVFAGIDSLKLLLGSAEGTPANLGETVARATHALRALMPESEPQAVGEAPVAPGQASDAELAAAARGEAPPSLEPAPALRPAVPRRKPEERAQKVIRPTIRINRDRLDVLMNLVGELVVARSRLDRRLIQLERVGELLYFSRLRMSRTVADFEGKYQYGRLPSTGTPEDGGALWASAGSGEAKLLSELFAELEFDRYDDFNILARSVGEISSDVSEVHNQLASLVRTIGEDTAQIQRLTGGLRNEITRARMVPVGNLFARFARQAREAAKEVEKTVTVEVSGEFVELDSTIADQITDPLLHLVRNAIGHGIEPEDERRSRGKPPHGTVYLRAYQQGGIIYIEVEDDGRGIDVEVLKEQAVAQGFLRPEVASRLSGSELLNLIFLPGFSTAAVVSAASGRGVGMDVVRTNVSRLNGEIDVETKAGTGTRFTIKLPLTVIISDVLMVLAGGEILAIPLAAVRLILTVRPEEIQAAGRAEMVRVQDELVDLIRLDQTLALPASEADEKILVVVLRSGGRSYAVAVNGLLGKEEVVIKSLGEFLEGVGPFAGATISGEGRVILVLDPTRLLETRGTGAVAAPVGAEQATEGVPAAPARHLPAQARRVVLLVDDSISVRKFVGQMLQKAGFTVITASDGAEALTQLTETAVHAVITDLEMPRVNGYELIEDLRRRHSTREIPVVVLTTRAGEKHLNLARRLGVKHYVTKPVEEHAFVRLIDSLTSTPAAEAALGGAPR